jgi:hypothetical protein
VPRIDVDALVAQVLEDNPLPATVADLDADSRRALERAAERENTTAEALLSVLRGRRQRAAESTDAAAIARRARRGY